MEYGTTTVTRSAFGGQGPILYAEAQLERDTEKVCETKYCEILLLIDYKLGKKCLLKFHRNYKICLYWAYSVKCIMEGANINTTQWKWLTQNKNALTKDQLVVYLEKHATHNGKVTA